MTRYRMIGRDINCSIPQYRSWVVDDTPDFNAEFYVDSKSGDNSLIDIKAYAINDDELVADFLLPTPLQWFSSHLTLPSQVANSQLAIIDKTIYLFGSSVSNKIYTSTTNDPSNWEDSGRVLPSNLFGSQFYKHNNTLYMFGGHDGYSATDQILTADESDPYSWVVSNGVLPTPLYNSQLVESSGYLYLLGGKDSHSSVKSILKASVNDPLSWEISNFSLPEKLSNSCSAVIDGYIYLFGGSITSYLNSNKIYRANVNTPLNWKISNVLPYKIHGGVFFSIGDNGYLITPGEVSSTRKSYGTRILRCNLSAPLQWQDTLRMVPGEVSNSQLAIIDDRIYLFGGSGSSVIFVSDQLIKFDLTSAKAESYSEKIYNISNWKIH